MKNNIWPNSSDRIQKLFSGTICFALFLPIIILPPAFIPSNWTRIILLKLILISLGFYLFFRFFRKKDISFNIFNRKNPVFILFLIFSLFFLAIIVSTIFSGDTRFSIFGSPIRSGGIINLLSYFAFALFLAIFIEEKYWEKLLKINLIAGFIASLFALIQYFGLFSSVFVPFSIGRAGPPSFLGNSTFLAIYMLFLAFLSFTFFVTETRRNNKILYGLLTLLFAFTILISGSRATYLGTLIGFVFYLLFYPKKLKILKIITVSVLTFIVAVIIIFNLFPNTGNQYSIFKTASSRLSIQNIAKDLAGNRLPAWEMSWQAIKEKPLFGWGPENFYIGFEKYYSPVNSSLEKEWWDRPHNIILDIWANYGILALVLYILFWVVILYKLQVFKKKETDLRKVYLAHSVQAMFLGYLTILFFNFDEFSSYFISFFFIGLSFCLISTHGEKKEILPPKTNALGKGFAFLVIIALVLFFAWSWNIKPLYLNEKIIWAENLVRQQKCDLALKITENIWGKSDILKAYSALSYVNFIKDCGATNQNKEMEYSQSSIDALKSISKIQPENSRLWLSIGAFSNILAAREENIEKRQEMLAEARIYLNKAVELSPGRQEFLAELEVNYMLAEDHQAMIKIGEDCIKINLQRGSCYWYLGIAQIFTGDQTNGKKNIEESRNKGYFDPVLLPLAVAYLSQENYKDAAEIYYQLAKRYHENAGYHAMAATLAKELGDYQKAAKEAVEVFRLQPNNPESLQFLQSLFAIARNNSEVELSMASVAYVYKETGKKNNNKDMLIESKNLYLQVISVNPKNVDYHWSLADVYSQLREFYKARNEAILVFQISPSTKKGVQEFLDKLPIEVELKILPN